MPAQISKRIYAIAAISILLLGVILIGLYVKKGKKAIKFEKASGEGRVEKELLQGELVGGFPDFPVYPKASVVTSRREEAGVNYETQWESSGTPLAIMKWFMDEFKKDSVWEVLEEPEVDQEYVEYSALIKRGEWLYYTTVEAGEDGGKTMIIVEVIPASLRGY